MRKTWGLGKYRLRPQGWILCGAFLLIAELGFCSEEVLSTDIGPTVSALASWKGELSLENEMDWSSSIVGAGTRTTVGFLSSIKLPSDFSIGLATEIERASSNAGTRSTWKDTDIALAREWRFAETSLEPKVELLGRLPTDTNEVGHGLRFAPGLGAGIVWESERFALDLRHSWFRYFRNLARIGVERENGERFGAEADRWRLEQKMGLEYKLNQRWLVGLGEEFTWSQRSLGGHAETLDLLQWIAYREGNYRFELGHAHAAIERGPGAEIARDPFRLASTDRSRILFKVLVSL